MNKNKVVLCLSGIVSVAFLCYFFYVTRDIGQTEQRLSQSPNVLDVTTSIQTKILVAAKDGAGVEWTKEGWDDQDWKSVTVPQHRLVQEPEFKEGSVAYYRIRISKETLEPLAHLDNELFLGLQYIHFSKLDIYVNGVFYRSNSPGSYVESIINIPLMTSHDNLVGIKGYVKQGDSGINHRGKILVGKGAELNELHRKTYKAMTVLPLLYILSKGSVYFIFFLIFLVMKVDRYFEKFLMYGLFVIAEDVLVADYVTKLLNLNQQVYIFNLVNLGIILFLFLFFSDVLGKPRSKKILISVFGGFTAFTFLISVDFLHTSYVFNITHLLMAWNLALMAVLGFFLPKVLKVDKVLFSFNLVTFCMMGLTTFNVGYNLKLPAGLLIFFMVAYQSFVLFRREQNQLQANQRQLLEQEKDVAIGKTAAILAHDVRKPLEQLSYILNQISSGNLNKDFIDAAKRDVDTSLTNVTSQISDIMNYSRTRELNLEPISFYRILARAIKQVKTVTSDVEINLNYDFQADSKILGDESRLSSVLTNLLSNGVEAIRDIGKKSSGAIRCATRLEGKNFVFTISNDGPLIPEAVLPEIFKPLFTHGKNKGTGLGLASANKIVRDHKGEIEVKNLEGNGVEFKLILQSASEPDRFSQSDFLQRLEFHQLPKTPHSQPETLPPLRIFLLDDDVQVYDYLKVITGDLPFRVEIGFAIDWESAVKLISEKRFDLYLIDYDIGSDKTGLDFYHLHLSFLSLEVVIHSNREKEYFRNDKLRHETKPIARGTLEDICQQVNANRTKVFMVDDSELTIMAWELFHGRHNFTGIDSPEAALKILSGDSQFDVCVVDYYFDNSKMNGVELAQQIRTIRPGLRVLLASSVELENPGLQVIEKNHYEVRSKG